jgi:hypothetical protein
VTTPAGTPIHPQFRLINGRSIRFAESEGRNDDALLVSPWPESLFAFEPIWARLADQAHLVTGFAVASAVGGAAAGASTGRDAT